jgi:protein-S-isoprenylcysteine O-methyltransferase Ste14
MPPDQKHDGALARILLRIPVPWTFVLTYLAGAGLEAIFHTGEFMRSYDFLTPIGAVLFVLGAVIAGWGWFIFHREHTTRVPGQTSTTLVTWGPYRFTRNPMYVGLFFAYLGEAALVRQIVPVILLPLTIIYLNLIVIPLEEKRLREVFGAEYGRYVNRVRRWL